MVERESWPATGDDDIAVLPAEGMSREELERQYSEPLRLVIEHAPTKWPQFSIGDLMIVMVGVAGGLAGGSWMPTDVFAATLGLLTLAGLLVVSWRPPQTHLGNLLWATLVIAYILAVLAAVLRPPVQGAA